MSNLKNILEFVDSCSVCEENDDEKYHSLIASKRDGSFMVHCSGMYYACVCVCVCVCVCARACVHVMW